ncbi:MAG: site-specific integrase [Firmicutes bacterium]|nr:site-specific integrase [Bacillota bacterium]
MTYQGKTIRKHIRGNWFARVRFGEKVISVYGRTKLDCYDKLKLVVDRVEQEKQNASAERYLQKLNIHVPVAQMQRAESKAKKPYTLKEWFDEWLNSYKVGRVRQATIDSFIKSFKPFHSLHDISINDITSLMLSKIIYDGNTAQGMRIPVCNLAQQMFLVAFNNRLIEVNPTSNFQIPKRVAKHEKKALTEAHEKIFISACMGNLDKYEPLLICCLQGLRKGEMLAIRPNDLCFTKNTLRIDESYDETHPDDLQVKNADSLRTMPMFKLTRELLLRHKDKDPHERIYQKYRSAMLSKRLEKLCKDNGLPRITIHELRHTFITRCHERGVEELTTQSWCGHAKGSRMTKAVYTHLTDDAEQKYIELFDGNN